MSKRLSDVSAAYVKNAYHLDLARREFERQALSIIEQVESDLGSVARRNTANGELSRWRSPQIESPQREIAWLNFKANASITMDVKPRGFRNFKKEAAFLYFEILFDDELNEFVFQSRFENQSVHPVLLDIDEKIIELARSADKVSMFPGSSHVKASTAIIFKLQITEEMLENLSPHIQHAIQLCESSISHLMPVAPEEVEVIGEDPIYANS